MSECDKMLEVRDKSMLLSEFLDWLDANEIYLFSENRYMETVLRGWENEHEEEIERIEMAAHIGRVESHEQLLARFFNIDLKKVEEERQKILAELRA